jgi:hypothetical protein
MKTESNRQSKGFRRFLRKDNSQKNSNDKVQMSNEIQMIK